jgi:protein-L-isoaspartate(D-aspartate) O-methyltransferase
MMLEVIQAYAEASREATGLDRFNTDLMRVMAEVPRHEFVPDEIKGYAYSDSPLPIGHDKTISQPFMVALMVELLDLEDEDVVLEVGTGLGYQAGIMSRLASRVYTLEIIEELAGGAVERLGRLGYHNAEVRVGNGYYGWREHAPFDKIVVAAAPEQIPPPLIEQLKPGGRMVIPLGPAGEVQQLVSIFKDVSGEVRAESKLPVSFAPLVMAH